MLFSVYMKLDFSEIVADCYIVCLHLCMLQLICNFDIVDCRYVYWSNDVSSAPCLERAGLDGIHRHTVITGVPHVSSLTIDYSQHRLYWLRVNGNCIESSDMSGGDRQLLMTGLQQPFGIAQYLDRVYWTDWKQQSIESVDKLTGSGRRVLLDGLSFPIHLNIFHVSRQLGTTISYSSNSDDLSVFTYVRIVRILLC